MTRAAASSLPRRRWRPPDKDEPGQHPPKAPPGPEARPLPLNSNDIITQTGHRTQIGAFAAAVDLRRRGLFPIPLGGAAGKTPLILRFTRIPRPSLATIEAWARRWPDASVGIVTGALSKITVVDVDSDDPAILRLVIERFGQPVIMIRTLRGGWHLYYRFAGERCRNLRREGLPVDVKGQGGFVVAPPSVRMTGENAGKPYTFERGCWVDLPRLQPIRPGSLAPQIQLASDRPPAPRQPQLRVRNGAVDVMGRNDTLFRVALRAAPQCCSELALLQHCLDINNCRFALPLETPEVAKLVHSAWGNEERGENRIDNRIRHRRAGLLAALAAVEPDAEWLFRIVRRANAASDARGRWFPVSPRSMAIKNVIPGWSRRRYDSALAVLIRFGLLILMRQGGRRPGHANLYRFRNEGDGPMPPLLVVSNADPDDVDLLRVAQAVNSGMSIRSAARALSLSKSQVGRLRQRARDAGELQRRSSAPKPVPASSSSVPATLSQKAGHKKEDTAPPARRPPLLPEADSALDVRREEASEAGKAEKTLPPPEEQALTISTRASDLFTPHAESIGATPQRHPPRPARPHAPSSVELAAHRAMLADIKGPLWTDEQNTAAATWCAGAWCLELAGSKNAAAVP